MERLWDYPFAKAILQRLDAKVFLMCQKVCSMWRLKLSNRYYLETVVQKAHAYLSNIPCSEEAKTAWLAFFSRSTNLDQDSELKVKILFFAYLKSLNFGRRLEFGPLGMQEIAIGEEDIKFFRTILHLTDNAFRFDPHLLNFALKFHKKDIAQLIIPTFSQVTLGTTFTYGKTALHMAAKEDFLDIVELLWSCMDHSHFIIGDFDGKTALHEASLLGHFEIVRFLVEKMTPSELAILDFRGRTALHLAASEGFLDVVLCLAGKIRQEDLAIVDANGRTALHSAVLYRQWEVAEALADKMRPTDLVIYDSNQKTALHSVADLSHWKILKFLSEKLPADLMSGLKVEDMTLTDFIASICDKF